MKKLLPLILMLSLLLTACKGSAGESFAGELSVYRVIKAEYQTDGGLLSAERVPVSDGEDELSAAVKALAAVPESDKLQSPLPAGIRIVGAEQSGDRVKVRLSSAYAELSGMDKTVLDACLTLTLCALDGVESVSVLVGSEELESGLRADDILLENTVTSADSVKVRLYFPGSHRLRCEYRSVSLTDDSSPERVIAEALMAGPKSAELQTAVPAGTVLLSVYTQEGVCTVSLSESFAEACAQTPESASLWVYSMVNTLCSLQSVDSVKLLIEGREAESLGNCDVSHALTKNEKLVGSPPGEG